MELMEKDTRILIVEDEVISAMYLQMELKKRDYIVIKIISTGEQAVKISRQERPDVILMDIHLAGKMDGIQAAVEILEDYEGCIIFMTGYDDLELKGVIKKLPFSYYIVKPVEIQLLIDKIETGLVHNSQTRG
jgi:DNA-binding response OmpR family regulator